jgi:dolichyl-phosphate-mannose-protein mannosyltransferase
MAYRQSIDQQNQREFPWYGFGMSIIFIVSVILRFWQLGRFNTLVFDEVYYAKFSNDYLTNTPFFNAHPPLSQYLIAWGIWLGSHLPFGQEITNNLAGSPLAPWTYRWLNALTGSFIPLVVGAIAYQLTRRKSYSLIVTLLVATDGLILVESRYALNNIYLVIFGLLGQLCLFIALNFSSKGHNIHKNYHNNNKNNKKRRWFWLIVAGLSFGASFSIKWNGLWFLLGTYLIIIASWFIKIFFNAKNQPTGNESYDIQLNKNQVNKNQFISPIARLTEFNLLELIFTLIIIPVGFYGLMWIPHLQQNPTPDFWQMQSEILGYHQRIQDGPKVHPYCAKWFTWPLMLRPIVYFYQNTESLKQPDLTLPNLPAHMQSAIYDVHAMGNPALWWFSAVAIILLIFILGHYFWVEIKGKFQKKRQRYSDQLINYDDHSNNINGLTNHIAFPPIVEIWLIFYLVSNWLANLLPWAKVTRCVFIYHYMGASIFAMLALAWWIERWLYSQKSYLRIIGLTVILLVLMSFVFWLPVYLGEPISGKAWQMRMWFKSWI